MSMNINNYKSTIGTQVIGTQIIQPDKENSLILVNKKLDEIFDFLKNELSSNGSLDIKTATRAVQELKDELNSRTPRSQIIERSINALGSISSIVSLVEQIRPFLKFIL